MTGGDFPCGRLTVTETNPAGCSGTDEVFGVSSYPNGTITVSPGISTICLNRSVAFSLECDRWAIHNLQLGFWRWYHCGQFRRFA